MLSRFLGNWNCQQFANCIEFMIKNCTFQNKSQFGWKTIESAFIPLAFQMHLWHFFSWLKLLLIDFFYLSLFKVSFWTFLHILKAHLHLPITLAFYALHCIWTFINIYGNQRKYFQNTIQCIKCLRKQNKSSRHP